jgi:exopolyphosphatase/guanosine-5'-triphosphate,3'-diphosphate pyrophosphatase
MPARSATGRKALTGRSKSSVVLAPKIFGVADIGSNSTHLLVAVTDGERVEPLIDASHALQLGALIADRGEIGKGPAAELGEVLSGFREQAVSAGAEAFAVVATEPLRRADDRVEALRRISSRFEGTVAVLDHAEEGLLTVLGLRHPHDRSKSLVVIDIGGGSTEIVHIAPNRPPRSFGVSIGSARLGGVERDDSPPSAKDWERLRAAASAGLGGVGLLRARQIVVAGGTATNQLRLVPSTLLDREIAPEDLAEMGEILATERASEIASTRGISNRRARMLPAGISILEALLRHTTASVAVVDRGGIREGLVVALARSGADWRSELIDLVIP